jgi:4-alpha-glucanotransferase
LQYEFKLQWQKLKAYANSKGVKIIGDIPLYVAYDSSDVWSHPQLFQLDDELKPTKVAGVPPDYFSETGQLWGNPLYDWQYHKETGYEWWISRVKMMLSLVDILRIDHFRAFESYWAIPYGSETAVKGKWKKGPGRELFDSIEQALGKLPIIAEDLGDLNPEVHDLRNELSFPGMKILQFAFGDTPNNDYLPHNFKTTNCIVYTGTHDNDTTLGWYDSMDAKTKDYFRRYLNVSGDDASWDMIRLAEMSIADTAIIPMQDLLNLGTDARMNTPGKPDGNWQFRFTRDMLTDDVAKGMAYITQLYNR